MEIVYALIGAILTLILTNEYAINKDFYSLYYSGLKLLKDNLIIGYDINKTSPVICEAYKIIDDMNRINFPLHITYLIYKNIIENFRDILYEYDDLYQCDAVTEKPFMDSKEQVEEIKKLYKKLNKKLRIKD